ncbi:MAG: hypothetical protein NPIRA03_22670 [Nitrospirales bacterium]|nr:MAG: hypothetical protein NPIRA03_22670 [Nitrospirales bacterium]
MGSWDFVHNLTTAGEPFRCLTVKDEATCLCLAMKVDRSLSHQRVIALLKHLLVLYGVPWSVRNDNAPELMVQSLLTFFKGHEITPSRITTGKLSHNGSKENFNGTFRGECSDAKCFHSLTQVQIVIEDWRRQYTRSAS